MSNEQALLNCTFGWGQTCRLYYDSIEIAGKSYDLKDLTSIHPSYRNLFGVPSARLELSFGLERLVLRGIADLSVARLMVSHLQPYCSTAPQTAHSRRRSTRSRHLARAQARAWERTNKLPIIPRSPAVSALATCSAIASGEDTSKVSGFAEEQPTDQVLTLDAVPKAPVEDTSLTPGETLEAFAQLANNLSTYSDPLPARSWQPPHTPRFFPPLHSVHLIHPNQKFDSGSMPVPALKSSVLPIIHVPVRLQHGECAHYSIGATLCSDRVTNGERATYPLLDNGLMILTNRRVLYVGKRCKFTLAYTHLWYVSLLHSAIALHIEGQFRRIIIELEHPQEWASRIELLSFIARRERPEPPTLSVAAVPGLNMTAKRRAIKPPSVKRQELAENPTIPLLTERATARVVEAETIDLDEQPAQAADGEPATAAPAPLELIRSNTPRSVDIAQKPTQEFEPNPEQPADITQKPTQEFTLTEQPVSDIAQSPTQEFALRQQPAGDIAQSPTQEFVLVQQQAGSDITQSPTQEFVLVERHPALDEVPTQAMMLAQDEIAQLSTREFSLPAQEAEQATGSGEVAKATRKLHLDQAETPDETRSEAAYEPVRNDSQAPDDDDDRTIHLHDRKLCQLRTVSLSTQAKDRPASVEKRERSRQPSHALPPRRAGAE
jgi:hypothetical protein